MINVIKFSKQGCRPCAVLSNYLSDIDFAAQNVTLSEVNIAEQPEAVDQYGLTSVPVLVFQRNGVEVHRITGLASTEEIVEAIDFARRAK